MQETANGFMVEIPPKRRTAAIIFSVGFVLLAAGFGYAVVQRASNSNAVLGVVICSLLVLGGVFVLFSELWGKEVIELDGYSLKVSEIQCGFRTSSQFDITMITYLRVGAADYWQGSTYVMSNGRIQFEYNRRMVSIGGRVSDAEAFDIVERIRNQLATLEKV